MSVFQKQGRKLIPVQNPEKYTQEITLADGKKVLALRSDVPANIVAIMG